MFVRPSGTEEIRLGAGGENEEITLKPLSIRSLDRPRFEIGRDHLRHFDIDIGMAAKKGA